MIKKIFAVGSIFGFIYIGCYTSLLEDVFNVGNVATSGGLVGYLLMGLIASVLIVKK